MESIKLILRDKQFIEEIKKDIQNNGNLKILIGKINKRLNIEKND